MRVRTDDQSSGVSILPQLNVAYMPLAVRDYALAGLDTVTCDAVTILVQLPSTLQS